MKKVFLSFCEEDREKVKNVLPLLNHPDFEFICFSFDSHLDFSEAKAEAIKKEIGSKIVSSSFTLCLITENTYKSRWVDCQLEKTRSKGNKIIAMALKNTKEAVLPKVIKEENLKFHPWGRERLFKLLSAS